MQVVKCWRETGVSQKSGKNYDMLKIEFENGYVLTTFLSHEQSYILMDVPVRDK